MGGDPNAMDGSPDMMGGEDPNAMGGSPDMMGGEDPNAMGGSPDMMGGGDPNAMGGSPDIMGGEDPNAMGGDPSQSQFDTNFDAGVEADEDEDPKHYIQQVAGKLSVELGNYLKDTEDPGTAKYAAKMVLKQAIKGLDGKGKKELIRTIKSDEAEDEEDIPEDDGSNMSQNGMEDDDMQMQQPMQESVFTKKQLRKIMESINPSEDDEDRKVTQSVKRIPKSRFLGKKF